MNPFLRHELEFPIYSIQNDTKTRVGTNDGTLAFFKRIMIAFDKPLA
jgi:hypothetical protein